MSTKIGSYHAIALAAAAAVAVGYSASAAEPLTEVIVEAPKVVRTPDRAQPLGAPIDIVSVRYRVSYADLDIATPDGAKAFEARITDAAKRACKHIDETMAPGTMEAQGGAACVKTAVDAAMVRAHEAIDAAVKKARK